MLPGKNAVIKQGATAINGLNDAGISFDGALIDGTTFSDGGWKKQLQGLKSGKLSLSGFYKGIDTGQVALYNAWANGSNVSVTYLPDGINGWTFDYKVSSMNMGAAVAGEVSVSYELESDGAVSVVSG